MAATACRMLPRGRLAGRGGGRGGGVGGGGYHVRTVLGRPGQAGRPSGVYQCIALPSLSSLSLSPRPVAPLGKSKPARLDLSMSAHRPGSPSTVRPSSSGHRNREPIVTTAATTLRCVGPPRYGHSPHRSQLPAPISPPRQLAPWPPPSSGLLSASSHTPRRWTRCSSCVHLRAWTARAPPATPGPLPPSSSPLGASVRAGTSRRCPLSSPFPESPVPAPSGGFPAPPPLVTIWAPSGARPPPPSAGQ